MAVLSRLQKARAAARRSFEKRAETVKHGADTLDGRVEIASRDCIHDGFYRFERLKLRHELFSGAMSPPLEREVFIGSDAAIVLPYDPLRDRVMLVEQLRIGPIGRKDPSPWQLEAIAGMVDEGETPIQAAHREAMEEAGLTFSHLKAAGECYASPGGVSDFFYLFVGVCDLPDEAAGIGGALDEGEDIRARLLSFDALLDRAERSEIANAPLQLLTYWLAHHRASLRDENR